MFLPGLTIYVQRKSTRQTTLRDLPLVQDHEDTVNSVERLMGTKAKARFDFIQERAEFASEDMMDV
jgi:topoisomerase-4 subunit B